MRSRPLRVALVVVGLAAVVYGVASWTGGCGSSCVDEPAVVLGTYVYDPADTRTLAGLAPNAPLSALLDLVPVENRESVSRVVVEIEHGYRVRLADGEFIVESVDSSHPESWRYRSKGRYEYSNGTLKIWPTTFVGKHVAWQPKMATCRISADAIVWPKNASDQIVKIPFDVVFRREPKGK